MTFNANLVRALQSTIRHNGPRPAILDGERTYTWAEFGGRVARLAAALRSMGVGAGSRFAILSRNRSAKPIAAMARQLVRRRLRAGRRHDDRHDRLRPAITVRSTPVTCGGA
jgi:acyl-CoA synthetase (AMP-forming)/AMP-acid ligase II